MAVGKLTRSVKAASADCKPTTPFVIGLTGGIGSGKSAAADILQSLGAYIIDADVLARRAVEKGSAGEKAARKLFPEAFADGRLDRRQLRSIVFADPAKAAALESITHPIILRLFEEEIKNREWRMENGGLLLTLKKFPSLRGAASGSEMENSQFSILNSQLIILVAPLLFECGLEKRCRQTWQISADKDLRIKRAAARDNVPCRDIEAVMARQLPDSERERRADKVIRNDGTLDELKKEITRLFGETQQ